MIVPPAHVVLVIEENHSYADIIANPRAPFINKLVSEGILFTNYAGITHPSLPNYLALFSGSTQGVTDDRRHSFSAPTIAGQLHQAGFTFVGYAERGSSQAHKPWESFAESAKAGRDFTEFPADFDRLPTLSFVIPNQQNDMHDGSIAEGDTWLMSNLGGYADWARNNNSLLIVTFDEGHGGGGEGNHVPTIVVGASIAPRRIGTAVNHYSLLRTIERLYGLPPLGDAASAPILPVGNPSQ